MNARAGMVVADIEKESVVRSVLLREGVGRSIFIFIIIILGGWKCFKL
jgi:hypothetical protein